MNKVNISHVLNIISISVIIESLFIFTSIPVALYYKESVALPLLFSFLVVFFSGISGFLITRKNVSEHSLRDTYASVVLTWIFISAFGALPFIFTGSIPNFHDAFFEAASGFSTTGATILKEVESLPKSVLLWRSETHLIGGMGIIVLIIVFLPLSKAGGQHMMMAEGSFVNSEKIKSRSIDVAKRMWLIYISLTVIEILLLTIAGMDLFDSVCHSFGTIATGGFSTKNNSIIGYSPLIQYILVFFMILGGVNFSLYYLLIHGKFKKFISNEELRFFLFIIFSAALIIALILKFNFNLNWEKSIRDSLFQVVSIITTTGYITSDYELWPHATQWVLLILMLIGSSTGSTAGGIKVARILVALKTSRQFVNKILRPNSIHSVKLNGQSVSTETTTSVIIFIFIFIVTIIFGIIIMALSGMEIKSAAGAVITTITCTGPGFFDVGATDNFSNISAFGKYFLSLNMIIGRLELLSFFVLIIPSFFKK